ncbi:PIG-L family deacetylase [Marivirga sp. S37H4]|uniref:PIG-L family deacetylase n=1 Tax=Marivirga aurantiaca TaxID=2802615 RepID=A0A934WX38_9BACT|nr:PIG-L family deacetylase [Marivirga aurantiaca]MBK6264425.1 PIG-L family deacetylase [Marivirga aurantiaca]
MNKYIIRLQLLILASFLFVHHNFAQYQQGNSSTEVLHDLQKLRHTARVLYIAAHPDDENTRLISYLSKGRKFETAYLSLTRGDGGQNVIGPELSEGLGLIRTQELLAARRIDGGNQFFTRANDFGYSKHPDETFNKWNREKVLSDVVWVIRNFQPDIIITRFNETPGSTHGHHTASAILAREAFHKAANPEIFPGQLEYVKTWETKKLYWNTSSWFFRGDKEFSEDDYTLVNVGEYSSVLGLSYTEIAALSRSQHKSQAFGSSGVRGEEIEYLEQWEGKGKNNALFDGISTNWDEFENGNKISSTIEQILSKYSAENPADIITDLLQLRDLIDQLPASAVRKNKLSQIDQLILKCSGFYHLLHHAQNYASPSDSLSVNMELVNRSEAEIELKRIEIAEVSFSKSYNQELANNEVLHLNLPVMISKDQSYSNPYWLEKGAANGMYQVDDQLKIGHPENKPTISATITLTINGQEMEISSPLMHKHTDRIKGEVIQPFYIVPAVSISFSEEVVIFTKEKQEKDLTIKVKALKNEVSGELQLELPDSWEVVSAKLMDFSLLDKNEEVSFNIRLRSGVNLGQYSLKAEVVLDNGTIIDQHLTEIQYDHIPHQVILNKAQSKLVLSDIQIVGKKIGYIEGAGDGVKEALRAMGYEVETINIATASIKELKQYDAIVAGIRAYNTNEALQDNYKKLFTYMELGGTYLVQYNTSYSLPEKDFWPYPLQISRDRITVEEAELEFLNPNHQLLNYPNKIQKIDFEDWIQERGLYFPANWDSNYQTILKGSDPGEAPLTGSVLTAKYGKGKFVYTGLSFFRELPAGVPGAYRIFANLVAPVPKK